MADPDSAFLSDYVSNPNLTALDKVFYYPGCVFTPLNLAINLFACYASIQDFKRFHINFLLLRYLILCSFLCIGLGHFAICFVCLYEDVIYPSRYTTVFTWGVYFCLTGCETLRVLYVFIFIERTIATVFSRSYEKRRETWITVVLVVTPVVLGVTIMYFKMINPDLQTVFYCIGFAFDVAGCLFVYFLRQYNNKLRKLHTRSTVVLTQRFQISENVRILKSILPLVALGVCISLFGTVFNILAIKVQAVAPYFRYSAASYYLLYNIYCIVATVIYASSDPRYRRRKYFNCCNAQVSDVVSHTSFKTSDHPLHQHVSVKNVNGIDVAQKMTNDEYFKAIQVQWDVSLR